MSVKPWKLISSKLNRSYRIFAIRTDKALSPRTGLEHDFFVLESSAWVNVIPLTPQNEVVMVRQYRHGIRDITLETPGGVVEADDSPEDAARRELFEETGYEASEMIALESVHANPAIQNNRCWFFLARDVFLAGDQQQDDKEDIDVSIQPLIEIPRLIREGEITHSLVLAAFCRYYAESRFDSQGSRTAQQ